MKSAYLGFCLAALASAVADARPLVDDIYACRFYLNDNLSAQRWDRVAPAKVPGTNVFSNKVEPDRVYMIHRASPELESVRAWTARNQKDYEKVIFSWTQVGNSGSTTNVTNSAETPDRKFTKVVLEDGRVYVLDLTKKEVQIFSFVFSEKGQVEVRDLVGTRTLECAHDIQTAAAMLAISEDSFDLEVLEKNRRERPRDTR